MRWAVVAMLGLLAGCVGGGDFVASGGGDARAIGSGGPLGPGGTLPVGEVAQVCARGSAARGAAVAQFPSEGRARWRILDTAPGSLRPRTQYITGLDGGCALQMTAALVVFGAPDVHETMRYDPANAAGYSATDAAYERIKGRVCGVRPRSPCPADRADRLSARTVFVTIYPQFGGTARQVELLLDDGELVAEVRGG